MTPYTSFISYNLWNMEDYTSITEVLGLLFHSIMHPLSSINPLLVHIHMI